MGVAFLLSAKIILFMTLVQARQLGKTAYPMCLKKKKHRLLGVLLCYRLLYVPNKAMGLLISCRSFFFSLQHLSFFFLLFFLQQG